ncbi:hypothetical protein HPB50_005426 [Hyalomma asiaticum]|uniref:Uncharacterized protein n=1 Tax=Hyalomma asiaticum TaxID=266040 RepID=A0ACB7S7K4_HYAAI|nr:hypothetical protein HPB50_005426 [Hyalomma asiaticum]
MTGPSTLASDGPSAVFILGKELSIKERACSTSLQRGRKLKIYMPQTAAIMKRLKNDVKCYRKPARKESRRELPTWEAPDKLKLHVSPEFINSCVAKCTPLSQEEEEEAAERC